MSAVPLGRRYTMSPTNTDPVVALDEFPRRVGPLDFSDADEVELKAVLTKIRAAQRCLDGVVMSIGRRSDELAAQGRAAPAAETMRADGAVSARQARREARRSETATIMPGIDQAVKEGQLSGEHVDAIARHSTKLTEEQRESLDIAAVVAKARQVPAETFERFLKRQVDDIRGDHGLGDTEAKRSASEFRHWFDHGSGMGRFSGSLDPERYEMLIGAVEHRTGSLAAAGGVEKDRNLAARALVDLAVRKGVAGSGSRLLPSILVVTDQATLAGAPRKNSLRQTEGGHDIAAASVERLACDAMIRGVTLDGHGVPIDVGRKYRTATDGQWAALKAIYSTCAWAGCRSPIGWCQAHHIEEWENGGRTDLKNLVPLCSQHHHRVHEGGWSVTLESDRTLQIHKPGGAHHATVPTPMRC